MAFEVIALHLKIPQVAASSYLPMEHEYVQFLFLGYRGRTLEDDFERPFVYIDVSQVKQDDIYNVRRSCSSLYILAFV